MSQTGLSELEKIYERYNQSIKRHSEIDRTIAILQELSQWFQCAESFEKAIKNQDLESVYDDLESLNSLLSALERKVPMIAILPKLRDKLQGLQRSAITACLDVWERSISVEIDDDSTKLTIRQTEGYANI